jgi:uncharacterized membrane protein
MASKTTNKVLMAAVAGLLTVGAIGASPARAADSDKVKCYGINSCKGKSSCAGGGHSCAGKNACKGQGAVDTTKDDCAKQGGSLTPPASK